MNKPMREPSTDDAIGPLDENGQQIWSAEEADAIERMHRDPGFWAGMERAEADIQAGRVFSNEEVEAHSLERRRRFLAERRN